MSGQEMVVAIVAISIFGGITITFIQSISKLIEKRMDSKRGGSELDKKFFDDYLAFKQEVYSELNQLKQMNKSSSKQKPLLDQENPISYEEEMTTSPRLKNMLDQKK